MHHSFLIMDKANIYLPACALFTDGRVVGGQASFVRGFNPQVVSRQRVVDHYHHYDDSRSCTTAFIFFSFWPLQATTGLYQLPFL